MADKGHKLTDEMLADLEKRLRDEYEQAAKEMQKKLDDYMKRYRTKDKIWRKWVENGKSKKKEISEWQALVRKGEKTEKQFLDWCRANKVRTPEQYQKWQTGQLAVGDRWERMKDRLVADQKHTNQIAQQIIQKQMPEVFALNANYAMYQVEHDAKIATSLTLYNREAVDRIMREDPALLRPPGKIVSKKIAEGKAERWEKQKIQSVMMQGILQGESIPKLASRLASAVADSDYKAAVRNARTMTTNAQNAGRYDAYERLQNNGVDLTLEWAATLDDRTRHEHRLMHGQRRDVGEPFVVDGIEIMYPAQTGDFMGVSESDIPQSMIWNCRCTILAWVKGFEHDTIKKSDKMGDMTFEEWQEAKGEPQDILSQKEKGEEIRDSYIRDYSDGRSDWKESKSGPENEEVKDEKQGDDRTAEEDYQYHATRRNSLAGIAEKGLKPNKGHFGSGVYLADSADDALEWTAETSTGGKKVLRVSKEFLEKGSFERYAANETDYGIAESIYEGTIPLEEIQIKVNDNGDEDDWWSLALYISNTKSIYRDLSKKTQKKIDKIVHKELFGN